MSQVDVTIRAAGLYTSPNPHADVPPGALRRADDIVIKRPGLIEPRPGLEDQSYGTHTGRLLHVLHPYDGDFVAITRTSGGASKLFNKSSTEVTLSASSISFAAHHVHSATVRGRLYLPSDSGLIRVEGAAATTATTAGLDRAKSGYGSRVAGNRDEDEWFPIQTAGTGTGTVAYRCVLAKEDADGDLRLGPPSGRWWVTAEAVARGVVDLTIPVHSTWAGLQLRIYRSEISTTSPPAPSDELAYVTKHVITAAEASAGTVSILDETLPDRRGESLYTNATQEGAEGEHARPPIVGTVAEYRDIVFGANVVGRSFKALEFTVVPTEWFNDSSSTETVDTTASSTALANWSWPNDDDLYGLYISEAGQMPDVADTYFSANTQIVGSAGPTFALDKNALSTAAGVSVSLHEWISIDGPNTSFAIYFVGEGNEDLANGYVATHDAGLGPQLYELERVIGSLAAAINLQDEDLTASHLGGGTLLIEAVRFGDTVDGVTLPHRLAENVGYDIAGFTSVASEDGVTDTKPNRLVWSALQVPEGFPPLQFLDIGSESHAIDALMAGRYGVYAFKHDGIWRIDGRTPNGLVVERIASARLCTPKCVDELDGEIFAWTDQGVVHVGAQGLAGNLSTAQLDVDLGERERSLPELATMCEGAFLFVDRGAGQIFVGFPLLVTDRYSFFTYVFDLTTKAWTRWTPFASHGASIDGRLYLAGGATNGVLYRARLASDTYPHHDSTFGATVSATANVTAETVDWTLTSLGGIATTGHWVIGVNAGGDQVRGAIQAYDGATDTATIRVAAAETTYDDVATVTVYTGPTCRIEWVAKTVQQPLARKIWSDVSLSFGVLDSFHLVEWDFRSDEVGTDVEAAWYRGPEEGRTHPESWRGGFVPRGAARAAQLVVEANIRNPAAVWSIEALQLRAMVEGLRVGQRTGVTLSASGTRERRPTRSWS